MKFDIEKHGNDKYTLYLPSGGQLDEWQIHSLAQGGSKNDFLRSIKESDDFDDNDIDYVISFIEENGGFQYK